MHSEWQQMLPALAGSAGADHAKPVVPAQGEFAGAWLSDLSHLAVLAFEGPDAEAFLHGQVSCDVRGLRVGSVTPGSYSTPKGRALATFLLWRTPHGFLLQLPGSLAEGIRKRLSMYVLRAKVKVTDRSDEGIRVGLVGPRAAAALERIGLQASAPPNSFGEARNPFADASPGNGIGLLRLPGDRFQLMPAEAPTAAQVWRALVALGVTFDPAAWDLASIRSGVADVLPATQEQFVPQMLNLDLVGGVSFDKGCYPGQEIVARSHFLGRLKRRMYRAAVAALPPAAGTDVWCAPLHEQAIGTVVAAAPAGGGRSEMLVVLQSEAAGRPDVTLATRDGPVLEWLALPYAIPSADGTAG